MWLTCSSFRWTTSGCGIATTTCSPTHCAAGWLGRSATDGRRPSPAGQRLFGRQGCCQRRSPCVTGDALTTPRLIEALMPSFASMGPPGVGRLARGPTEPVRVHGRCCT
jgi:hypothetical protein